MARAKKSKASEPIDVEPVEVTEVVPLRMYEARVDELVPSPTNPRKTFRGVEELAESVRTKGVLQPLLVRRAAGRLEVVAGERRFRAASLAGLERVPVIERVMTDEEVLEAQVIENNQRVDVDPLEEARGFAALLEHGRDVAEIAARLGRSETYVRARLRLVHLVPRGAWALEHELVTLSGALVIAALPADRQEEVLDELGHNLDWPETGEEVGKCGGAASLADVRSHVRRGGRLLERAPWGLADAGLVPVAGACTRCPRRTGAQADLFGEQGDDRCLDAACWTMKLDATLERHRSAGGRVIEGDEAKAVVGYGNLLTWSAPLVALDGRVPLVGEDRSDDEPTWRGVLAEVLTREPCVLVRTPDDQVIEAFDRAAAYAAIADRYPTTAEEQREELLRIERQRAPSGDEGGTSAAQDDWKARQREADRKAKIERDAQARCLSLLVDEMWTKGLPTDALEELVRAAERALWSQAAELVTKRRGWARDALVAEARKLGSEEALLGLLAELLLAQEIARVGVSGAAGDPLKNDGPFAALLRIYGIDPKTARAEVKKAAAAKGKKRPR